MIGMFVLTTIIMSFVYMTDFYVLEKGFGNSVVTGYINAISLVVGIISCLTATVFLEKFKNKNLYVAVFFSVAAFAELTYGLSNSLFLIVVVTFLASIIMSWPLIYYGVYIGKTVPQKQRNLCVTIYTILMYLTSLVAPYVRNITGILFGDYSIASASYYGGILLAILAVVYVVKAFIFRNNLNTYY